MSNQDIRWIQRANNFDKAFSQLKEAVETGTQTPTLKAGSTGINTRL